MKLAKLCVLFDFDDRRLRLGGAGGCTGSGRASRRKTTGRRHVTASGRAARRAGARATRYSRAADAHSGTGGPAADHRRPARRRHLAHGCTDRHVRAGRAGRGRSGDRENRSASRVRQRAPLLQHLRPLFRSRPGARQPIRSRQAGQRRYGHDLHRAVSRLPPRLLLFRQWLRRATRLDGRRAERAKQFGRGNVLQRRCFLPAVRSWRMAGRRRYRSRSRAFDTLAVAPAKPTVGASRSGGKSRARDESAVWSPVSRNNPEFPQSDRRS